MPKGSELTQARKDEIINACAELYETMNFKDVTLKDIGTKTSFTRTLIYYYFQGKPKPKWLYIFACRILRQWRKGSWSQGSNRRCGTRKNTSLYRLYPLRC